METTWLDTMRRMTRRDAAFCAGAKYRRDIRHSCVLAVNLSICMISRPLHMSKVQLPDMPDHDALDAGFAVWTAVGGLHSGLYGLAIGAHFSVRDYA